MPALFCYLTFDPHLMQSPIAVGPFQPPSPGSAVLAADRAQPGWDHPWARSAAYFLGRRDHAAIATRRSAAGCSMSWRASAPIAQTTSTATPARCCAAGAFSGEVDAAPSAVSVAPARRLEREPPHRRFGLDGCTKLSRAELVQDILSLRACERTVENHLRDDPALLMSRKRMQRRDGLLNLRDRVRVRHGSTHDSPSAS